MSFRAHDVKAARRANLFAFRLTLLADLLHQLFERFRLRFRHAVLLFETQLREHFRIAAQQNIRAATSHVRADRDRSFATRLRHHVRFVLVVFGIQNRVLDALFREDFRDRRALLDARRTHENRLSLLVLLHDLVDDRREFLAFRFVHDVLFVDANAVLVRRNLHDVQLVGRVKLSSFRVGRAGHARELLVDAEKVLEGDRRHRATFFLNPHVFLRFDCLMQTIRPTTSREDAAGEFVDDQHLAITHQVVDFALVERVRAQALVHDVQRFEVHGIVKVFPFDRPDRIEQLLGHFRTVVRERDGVAFFIDVVVLFVA